jgi:hypothetical protein
MHTNEVFEVRGLQHGVPVLTVYKQRKRAIQFAETLQESEVLCRRTGEYIFGTSSFVQFLLLEKKSLTLVASTQKGTVSP